jgi:hypothetical protein
MSDYFLIQIHFRSGAAQIRTDFFRFRLHNTAHKKHQRHHCANKNPENVYVNMVNRRLLKPISKSTSVVRLFPATLRGKKLSKTAYYLSLINRIVWYVCAQKRHIIGNFGKVITFYLYSNRNLNPMSCVTIFTGICINPTNLEELWVWSGNRTS